MVCDGFSESAVGTVECGSPGVVWVVELGGKLLVRTIVRLPCNKETEHANHESLGSDPRIVTSANVFHRFLSGTRDAIASSDGIWFSRAREAIGFSGLSAGIDGHRSSNGSQFD